MTFQPGKESDDARNSMPSGYYIFKVWREGYKMGIQEIGAQFPKEAARLFLAKIDPKVDCKIIVKDNYGALRSYDVKAVPSVEYKVPESVPYRETT